MTSMCILLTIEIAVWSENVSVPYSPFITMRDGGKIDTSRHFLHLARKSKLEIVREQHRLIQFRGPTLPLYGFLQRRGLGPLLCYVMGLNER